MYCKSARTNFLHPATIVISSLFLTHTRARTHVRTQHTHTHTHTHTLSLSHAKKTYPLMNAYIFFSLSIYFYFYLATIFIIMRRNYSLRVPFVCTMSDYIKNAVLALAEKRSENRPTAPRRVLNLRRSIHLEININDYASLFCR